MIYIDYFELSPVFIAVIVFSCGDFVKALKQILYAITELNRFI